jgi:hypothetical protein
MRTFLFKVAGVTFDGRQALIAKLNGDEPVRAVPEPTNPYDKNAIAIHIAHGDEVLHVGYMPKDKAREYAPLLEGENIDGRIAEITGGFEMDDGSTAALGLVVKFELPEDEPTSIEDIRNRFRAIDSQDDYHA